MFVQKIAPMKLLSTAEVCERYGLSRFTLSRRVKEQKFPSPTERNRNGNAWDVKVLEEFDEARRKLTSKTWTRAVVTV